MESLLSKKAQMGKLQGIIISLLVIGIVLGLGFLILSAFQEQVGDSTGTVNNETVTLADLPSGVFVDYNSTSANMWCYHDFNPVTVTNSTSGTIITSANYSYYAASGRMWNLTSETVLVGTVVNVSYTYGYGDTEACHALNETVEATEKIPAWLTIIVILLIVGVLLFIVFKVLPLSGEESSFGGFSEFGRSSGTVAEI